MRNNLAPSRSICKSPEEKAFQSWIGRRPGMSDVILETHGLIGPNGAGKTTCFNLLTKFLQPTHGRISFKGRDITGLRPAQVARLGLGRSFQISAVFPRLTALENVRLALQRVRGN